MTWLTRGFELFPADTSLLAWLAAARGPALAAVGDPTMRARWLRHGGTWFAGVDVLENDVAGRVGQGPPLAGAALAAAEAVSGPLPLHRAQVSVTYPGYPRRDAEESETVHRYRLRRDAAHLDGLLPEGADRRRHLREPHAWILGVALSDADPGASPLVVWEGSPEIMRAAFRAAFCAKAPEDWGDIDVNDAYQAARRHCFETCPRIEIALRPGEAVLVHRLALHGIAPWAHGAGAAPEGRAIAYFRPCLTSVSDWLILP